MDKPDNTVFVMQQQTLATVTAAVVTARGKPTSVNEVLEIMASFAHVLYPQVNTTSFQKWNEQRVAHLSKVHE
jgi:hypothetical protein